MFYNCCNKMFLCPKIKELISCTSQSTPYWPFCIKLNSARLFNWNDFQNRCINSKFEYFGPQISLIIGTRSDVIKNISKVYQLISWCYNHLWNIRRNQLPLVITRCNLVSSNEWGFCLILNKGWYKNVTKNKYVVLLIHVKR